MSSCGSIVRTLGPVGWATAEIPGFLTDLHSHGTELHIHTAKCWKYMHNHIFAS
jgi:hypothetical protein